jgi:hypothetical protein
VKADDTVSVRNALKIKFVGWLRRACDRRIRGVSAIAYRTADEDQKLKKDLPGHPDYAAKVRFRLVPGCLVVAEFRGTPA